MAISLAGVANVLYLGDSLTAGLYSSVEATCWRKLTDTYLATQGITGDSVYIGGAGGVTGGYLSNLATLTSAAADLCFIELGTNDVGTGVPLATFESNLRAIAGAVYDGNASCIFVFMTTWNEGAAAVSYDAAIRDVASDYSGALVDLYPIGQAPETHSPSAEPTWVAPYVSDGWHPNDVGHKAIANAVECLFDADLKRLGNPVGTDGVYSVAGDSIHIVWSAGSDFTDSGEFGIWVMSSGGTWYLGATVPATGEAAYRKLALTTSIAAPAATGYYVVVGWRATVGSGAWGSYSSFTSDTFELTSTGTMAVTEPASDGYAGLEEAVTVEWDNGVTVASGDFGVWAVAVGGGYILGATVPADGSRYYSHALTMSAAAGIVLGGIYKFVVAYRTTSGSEWTRFAESAGHYTIASSGVGILSYGGLDLNDGTTYTLLDGADPGVQVKTWDEYRGLDGTAAQANVSSANLIDMHFPLKVQAASIADLKAAVKAINDLVDAGPQTLIFDDGGGSVSYSCGDSQRVHFVPTSSAINKFWTLIDFDPVRHS